jgi:hypothetical protein
MTLSPESIPRTGLRENPGIGGICQTPTDGLQQSHGIRYMLDDMADDGIGRGFAQAAPVAFESQPPIQ